MFLQVRNKYYLILTVIFFSACSKEKKEAPGIVDQMQNFVINIAEYARNYDDSFIIIVQNGEELAFNNADTTGGIRNLHKSFFNAVDAFSAEEVHCSGTFNIDEYRREILLMLGPDYPDTQHKTIMVSDFMLDNDDLYRVLYMSDEFSLLYFIRLADNYDYSQIPEFGNIGLDRDVTSLNLVYHYLCLLSTKNFSDRTQMIDLIASTYYDLVIIEPFFDDYMLTPADVERIRFTPNGTKRLVIARISIGSAENYRYYWQNLWNTSPPDWIQNPYENHPGEYWVDFRYKDWQSIIYGNDDSYMKKIIDAGFDGVFLDNVEAYKQVEQSE